MIKRFIHIVLLSCLVMCAVFPGFAQKTASGQPNIVESIIASSDSTITIDIPDALLKELLPGTQAPARKLKRNVERQRRPGIVSGYRIQIFADGRNQTTLLYCPVFLNSATKYILFQKLPTGIPV